MSRPVRTPHDLVKFGIHFAEIDLSKLKARGLRQLRNQLASALGRDSASVDSVRAGVLVSRRFDGPSPDQYGRAELGRLQVEVTRLMQSVAGGAHRHLAPIDLGSIRVITLPYKDKSIWHLQGTVMAVFLHILLLALSQTDNRIVRRCPECPRLVAAEGKRRYCSRRCTNRASMKEFVRRTGRERLRLAKRRAYERRVLPGRARRYRPRLSS